jgi:hypothetical protein
MYQNKKSESYFNNHYIIDKPILSATFIKVHFACLVLLQYHYIWFPNKCEATYKSFISALPQLLFALLITFYRLLSYSTSTQLCFNTGGTEISRKRALVPYYRKISP